MVWITLLTPEVKDAIALILGDHCFPQLTVIDIYLQEVGSVARGNRMILLYNSIHNMHAYWIFELVKDHMIFTKPCLCDKSVIYEYEGTKVRGDEGTRGRRYEGTKVRGDEGTRGRRYVGTKVQGDQGTRGRRYEGTKEQGDVGTRGRTRAVSMCL